MDELNFKKIFIKDDVTENFFMLRHTEGGVKYMVSETLKAEREESGCTGIAFRPSELARNEWVVWKGRGTLFTANPGKRSEKSLATAGHYKTQGFYNQIIVARFKQITMHAQFHRLIPQINS